MIEYNPTEDSSKDFQTEIVEYINDFLQVHDISPDEGYRTDSYSNEEILEIHDVPMDIDNISSYLNMLNNGTYNSYFKHIHIKDMEGELREEVLDSYSNYPEDCRVDAHVLERKSFAIVLVIVGNNNSSTVYIKHLENTTEGLVNRWWEKREKRVDLRLVRAKDLKPKRGSL